MDERRAIEPVPARNPTISDRTSDCELEVRRTFDAPARFVFEAWTRPELLMQWWAPKSFGITLLSCEIDLRDGGTYRFEFGVPGSDQPMAFVGKYVEVTPPTRLVWTNEETEDGALTTVTFEEKDGKTLLVHRERYPSREALDAAIASGSTAGYEEQFEVLDTLLASVPER